MSSNHTDKKVFYPSVASRTLWLWGSENAPDIRRHAGAMIRKRTVI